MLIRLDLPQIPPLPARTPIASGVESKVYDLFQNALAPGRRSRGPWNKWAGFIGPLYAAKASLPPGGGQRSGQLLGMFFIPGGCLTASAGPGAAPQ